MKESIEKLCKEFERINKLGFVKGVYENSFGNVGSTFEKLLGKDYTENFSIPDYYGIEIKTTGENSKMPITLFCLEPTSQLFESNRLKETYGYKKKDSNNKEFYCQICCNKYIRVNGYFMKLFINYLEKRIYLYIYYNYKIIDKKAYWDFNEIQEVLKRKLNTLALIVAKNKSINNNKYFHYKRIEIYNNINFNSFIKLLENGFITIYFSVSYHKKQEKFGKTYNHGTKFAINKDSIIKLYLEKIDL